MFAFIGIGLFVIACLAVTYFCIRFIEEAEESVSAEEPILDEEFEEEEVKEKNMTLSVYLDVSAGKRGQRFYYRLPESEARAELNRVCTAMMEDPDGVILIGNPKHSQGVFKVKFIVNIDLE